MSMQSEGKNSEERDQPQSTGDGTGNVISSGSGESDAMGGLAAGQDNPQSDQQSSQQDAMPPSQTDDDQYDQGTVQRES